MYCVRITWADSEHPGFLCYDYDNVTVYEAKGDADRAAENWSRSFPEVRYEVQPINLVPRGGGLG